ncbi:transcriptional regulator, LysR family [Luminiphilus syltensis NOR5-1B]|uniref:Transcriptional regulator, LysR family n=1 Tax=Luminiphilus syltensis NOR5-1B TaxID=565045 RepID=B8KQZ9_9GAMM|nr:LysR family transcriptional regulator [Luminiphilus syltensis]EED36460.1 transcriptional regulator, LysR family [Luminiphilus syltensis NOR5-1B]
MNIRLLAKTDLNLLVSLHVLLEERSVSRAAERLSITQPAMSKTLARLRETFDDPLFSRSKRGIQPTPRAMALSAELYRLLNKIESLLDAGEFSPGAYRGEISIAISEYVGFTLLPPLTGHLQSKAPKLRLRTITRAENQLELLAQGSLDFCIQITRDSYPPEYRTFPLASSPLALFVRRDHPLVGNTLTRASVAEFPMINLYVADRSQSGLNETVLNGAPVGTLETSHLLTAFEVLRETDYTLVCPAYLARNDGATRDVVALPLPPGETRNVDYSLVAHERTSRSPIHQWLWNQIIDTVRSMRVRMVHRG